MQRKLLKSEVLDEGFKNGIREAREIIRNLILESSEDDDDNDDDPTEGDNDDDEPVQDDGEPENNEEGEGGDETIEYEAEDWDAFLDKLDEMVDECSEDSITFIDYSETAFTYFFKFVEAETDVESIKASYAEGFKGATITCLEDEDYCTIDATFEDNEGRFGGEDFHLIAKVYH